mgnify:FL=1
MLTEKAVASGAKHPSEYKAFFEACAFCYEKGYNKKTTFTEWIEEESFFD